MPSSKKIIGYVDGIKNHEMSYEEVMKFATDLEKDMLETFKKSTLPESPDRLELDNILVNEPIYIKCHLETKSS